MIQKVMLDANTLQVITTIGTVVIALVALALSVWQFRASHTHNKLSVRPFLAFDASYDPTVRGFGLRVSNKGVGPAFILDFRILVDGKDETASAPHPWADALKKLDLNYPFVQHFSLVGSDTAISPQETVPLITADLDQIMKDMVHHMKNRLPRIGVVISYKSVYGEHFLVRHEGNPELLSDKEWTKEPNLPAPASEGAAGERVVATSGDSMRLNGWQRLWLVTSVIAVIPVVVVVLAFQRGTKLGEDPAVLSQLMANEVTIAEITGIGQVKFPNDLSEEEIARHVKTGMSTSPPSVIEIAAKLTEERNEKAAAKAHADNEAARAENLRNWGYGFGGWLVFVVLLYVSGWTVGWINRGFIAT